MSDSDQQERPRNVGIGSWTIRRRIIISTLLFCAATIVYILGWGDGRAVEETIATNSFWIAGTVIGCYVFGATWDDKNKRK